VYWSAAPTTLTAATTSSEASWNSRSALLRDAAAAVAVETEEPSGAGGDLCTPGTKASSPSHNLLLRWLLGVAACACAGGGAEEAVIADDCRRDEARAAGVAVGGEKRISTEAAEAVATTRVSRGMCDGDVFDAGTATPPPLPQLAEPRRIRTADSGEVSARVFNTRATAAAALAADERRRRSLDMFASATRQQQSSQNPAFTIVAGTSTAARDAGGAGASATIRRDDPGAAAGDDAASSDGELVECAYPPSEASVVWSVVTADGVASAGNFSSAASGYYHHYYYHNGGGGDGRRTDAGKSSRRSSAGSLLTMGCMSDRALDAISPARVVHRRPLPPGGGRRWCHVARRR
jgi:hypothetical protein